MESPEHEERAVREYMASQAPQEEVVHVEKVAVEHVLATPYSVWDVHTTDGRWWVVTPPMNLNTQADFKSMDVVLSFHIGLMSGVMSRREAPAAVAKKARFLSPFRKWEQAAEAHEEAEEAEDFQAVGMRCREALLAFVEATASEEFLLAGSPLPKRSDFKGWIEPIANHVAAGSSASRLRSYLKAVSFESWDYVNWLTHAKNASRFDASMAVEATGNALAGLTTPVIRWERESPERCPSCGSYGLARDWGSDSNETFLLCEECGRERLDDDSTVNNDESELFDDGPPEGECTPSSDIATYIRASYLGRRQRRSRAARRRTSLQSHHLLAAALPPLPRVGF